MIKLYTTTLELGCYCVDWIFQIHNRAHMYRAFIYAIKNLGLVQFAGPIHIQKMHMHQCNSEKKSHSLTHKRYFHFLRRQSAIQIFKFNRILFPLICRRLFVLLCLLAFFLFHVHSRYIKRYMSHSRSLLFLLFDHVQLLFLFYFFFIVVLCVLLLSSLCLFMITSMPRLRKKIDPTTKIAHCVWAVAAQANDLRNLSIQTKRFHTCVSHTYLKRERQKKPRVLNF